jgi:hypothetical protein
MPTWKCVIPGYDLISPNKLLRMKWFMQSQEKESAMQLLALFGRPLPQYQCPVRMVIARMYGKGQRPLDTDNLYGGCKLLIDAMKAPKGRSRRGLSIIMEDNPKALDLSVVQFKNSATSCDVAIWACPTSEILDLPEEVAILLGESPKTRAAH